MLLMNVIIYSKMRININIEKALPDIALVGNVIIQG